MTNLYKNESSNPTSNAQRNLMGRTHYVDPDTLRFHKSRVIRASHHGEGLLFSIVTSDALDYQNTKRGFRYVIFDVFGTCLERPDLEHSYRTSEQASTARWAALNRIDAKGHTLEAIGRQRKALNTELDQFACAVMGLGEDKAGLDANLDPSALEAAYNAAIPGPVKA